MLSCLMSNVSSFPTYSPGFAVEVLALLFSVSVALNLNWLLSDISPHAYELLNDMMVLAHDVQVCSPISTKPVPLMFSHPVIVTMSPLLSDT